MPTDILVPVDGSDLSERALDYALNQPDAAITVLTVIDPFDVDPLSPGLQTPTGVPGVPGFSQEWYENEWEKVEMYHEELADRAADAGVDFETEMEFGNPARHILSHLDDGDYDQVVIGATTDRGMSRAIFGSTARKVTERAPVTVTVVRS
ncbi:universal stress protein [Halobacteriales archaeon Cl-PHB]